MFKSKILFSLTILLLLQIQFFVKDITAQTEPPPPPSRQEILRGSVTPEREWWDVTALSSGGRIFSR